MSNSSIALIGYRGTGKTTVAQIGCHSRLSYDWVDADVEVELRAGKSIAAIFEDLGRSRLFAISRSPKSWQNSVSAKRPFWP